MKKEQDIIVSIEYGKEDLKELLVNLLKEQYINYITMNEKKASYSH